MTILENPMEATLATSNTTTAPPISPLRDEENIVTVTTEDNRAAQENNDINTGNTESDDDDDDLTIISLDQDPQDHDYDAAALAWMEQNGPEIERRRRNVLLRELQRVQRASFIHFVLLCLIPTALLCIVVATVLSDEEPCGSDVTICRQEARTFINAFTTRCICDAIHVNREG